MGSDPSFTSSQVVRDGFPYTVSTFKTIVYETPTIDPASPNKRHPDEHIARIILNRPKQRNAQDIQMTYDLNAAFDLAAQDDAIKVIVLSGGESPHFCAGHDLADNGNVEDHKIVGTWCGFHSGGSESQMSKEEEIYLGICRRWRSIPKPTIAMVHGKTIAGGLMLVWVCDLIIASEDATFSDPVVSMGVNGVEWFAHPWELGPRKAKEFLFTADTWTAQEAHRLGMVNHVVPRDRLESSTMAIARRIALKPMFGLKLTKESVNQTLDAQGQWTAMQSVFSMHQIAHSNNLLRFGQLIDPSYINTGSVTKKVNNKL
ncbi:ClpP/crotonase [Gonapodya prolifera JEL478]|uniref:ClpP/crotonase n=1 Tax=Gonapodya prolifera (strain JEL478) TaxID=1344416 RepID=A0A139AXS4_GONPJ|nr:ClpP/crotonase [Gonapodya prolifera JEL478]|eukprot:KXS21520.1 ClpP/crotonase [Gonapodya prolifera JEL478]